jgi:hypothetical protein
MTDEQSKSYVALLALLSLVVLLGAGLDVAGQTPTQAQPQQRPRLAGSVYPPAVMASATSSRGEEVGENDVVRVDTQLITVPVVVRDQQGRHVTGPPPFSFTKTTSRSASRPLRRRIHLSRSLSF